MSRQLDLWNKLSEENTLQEVQQYIKNVIEIRGFSNQEIEKTMLLLLEEVGELAEVIRKNKRMEKGKSIKGTIEEELQDVLYYIVCLANINDIDLQECIYLKEKLNCKKY